MGARGEPVKESVLPMSRQTPRSSYGSSTAIMTASTQNNEMTKLTRDSTMVPSECHGSKLDNLDQTLWHAFSSTAAASPNADAIVSLWQPQDGIAASKTARDTLEQTTDLEKPAYLRWSYTDLYFRASTLAKWLRDRNCQPNACLAAFLWNSAEWGLFFWASARLGVAFVPLDPRLLESEGDKFLAATKPSVLVAQDADATVTLDTKWAKDRGSVIRIQCSGDAVVGWTLLGDILSTQDLVPILNSHSAPDADQTYHIDKMKVQISMGHACPQDTALIVFTSGTTNTPKGCPHTHAGLTAQTHLYDPNTDSDLVDRWLVHTPVSHIFAVNNAVRAWRQGHAVVFPSKAFDVQATLRALIDEQCTVMSAVPTLVKALLGNPLFPGKEALNLKLITIGGTIITPEDIRLCQDGLGADHAVQAYGMSEGAPVISWNRTDKVLNANHGYHPGVGKALPGVNLRVCTPETREPVAREKVGELHIGGVAVISGYLDGVEPQSFYTNEVGNWLVTGDQARMDSDGIVYIIGRYKDIIIRGGENISPVKLETAIGEIQGVIAQVVGVFDNVAGQVPVAVVKLPETVSKKDVLAKCRELGPMYALDGVYTLEDLGLEAFPMTSLGKIKKEVLKGIIQGLREPAEMETNGKLGEAVSVEDPVKSAKQDAVNSAKDAVVSDGTCDNNRVTTLMQEKNGAITVPEINGAIIPVPETNGTENHNGQGESPVPSTAEQLALIWEELIGSKPGLDDSISTFADSITLLRYCDRVQTTLHQRLYIQDLVEHDTTGKQATLIEQRRGQTAGSNGFGFPSFTGGSPFPNEHIPDGNAGIYHPTPTKPNPISTEEDITLAATRAAISAGFTPSDIEDILRIKDGFHSLAIGSRPQTYHIRVPFRVHSVPLNQIREGIEAALATRPIFRTIIGRLPNLHPVHVVIRAHAGLFDGMIQTRMIRDMEELEGVIKDGHAASHTSPFMARFTLLTVPTLNSNPPSDPDTGPGSKEIYLLATYNHSILDALSITPWHLDLERLILDPTSAIPPLTPFKLYSDVHHNYSTSLPAQTAVSRTVARLRGISRFPRALWPVQRAPGWMMSDSSAVSLAEERNLVRDRIWDHDGGWQANAKEFQFPRYNRVVSLHGMDNLRKRGIPPKLLMKTAIAVFNVLQTGERHAIFGTLHAAREWPFLTPWLARALPPAMSIDGPTAEWAVELVEIVRPGETVVEMVARMGQEDREVEKYVQAPWLKVLEGLGEEASTVVDAGMRQAFVWDVTMGMTKGLYSGGAKTLEPMGRYDWPDCGLFWNAFMLDSVNLSFIATWDSAQLSVGEVEEHCETMAMVLRKLVREENWARTVSDVFL